MQKDRLSYLEKFKRQHSSEFQQRILARQRLLEARADEEVRRLYEEFEAQKKSISSPIRERLDGNARKRPVSRLVRSKFGNSKPFRLAAPPRLDSAQKGCGCDQLGERMIARPQHSRAGKIVLSVPHKIQSAHESLSKKCDNIGHNSGRNSLIVSAPKTRSDNRISRDYRLSNKIWMENSQFAIPGKIISRFSHEKRLRSASRDRMTRIKCRHRADDLTDLDESKLEEMRERHEAAVLHVNKLIEEMKL